MGSSISSVIAQMILEELESDVISKINFPLPFFLRYVDDCLTAVPLNKCDYILSCFNKYNEKIKFTIEHEQNEKINFLDMTLHCIKNSIQTEWYQNPTWSGRYLNFCSNHPVTQNKSVIIGQADRAIKLSSQSYQTKSIIKAKEILRKNSYPEN